MKNSNIYYTDENGEVKAFRMDTSDYKNHIPHEHGVMEIDGTKGRSANPKPRRYKVLLGENSNTKQESINTYINNQNEHKFYSLDTQDKIYAKINSLFEDGLPFLSEVEHVFRHVPPSLVFYFKSILRFFVEGTGRKIIDDTKLRKRQQADKDKVKLKKKNSKKHNKTLKLTKHKIRNTSDTYQSTDQVQYNHPSKRKPKYGYARDRFGRIQERDHYVENRPVNPYNSSNSLYDREDDSTSAYDDMD